MSCSRTGWPRSDERLALDPALLALIERVLRTPVDDVGALYRESRGPP